MVNEWIKENYQLLMEKVPNLEDLTFAQLCKIIENDEIYEQEEKILDNEEEDGEVPLYEFNQKKTKEMEMLEQMKKDLIEQYVYEDEIEKKEKLILREIEKVQTKGVK